MDQTFDLAAEAERNRRLRDSKRAALERRRRRGSGLVSALKWAATPLNGAVHAGRIALRNRHRASRIATYLSGPGFKGLQVGCGRYPLSGWLNSDYLFARPFFRGLTPAERVMDFHIDITRPLPCPDGAFDAIFAEEVIEHVDRPAGVFFVSEAARILKPGGVLRITTPDARGVCAVFAGAVPDVSVADWEPFWTNPYWGDDIWLNGNFRYYGHQHLWTFEALEAELRQAGFARVVRTGVHQTASSLPQLGHVERHSVSNPEIIRITRATRMILEAFR